MLLWVTQLSAVAALSLTRHAGGVDRLLHFRERQDPIAAPAPVLDTSTDAGIAAVVDESLEDQVDASSTDAAANDLVEAFVPPAEDLPSSAEDLTVENVEEGEPTFAPVAAHSVGDPVAAVADDVTELVPTPPPADVAARDDVQECSCDCCVSVERAEPVISTNWTCTPAAEGMANANLACHLDTAYTCALTKYDPPEVFDYHLFCRSHCKTVATTPQTQCMALSDDELDNAKDGGVWVDHKLPAVAEAQDEAAAAAAKQASLPTSSPEEQADEAEMADIVKSMWGPNGDGTESGAVYAAGLSHGNAKFAAGVA
jgi:hypothetical protein